MQLQLYMNTHSCFWSGHREIYDTFRCVHIIVWGITALLHVCGAISTCFFTPIYMLYTLLRALTLTSLGIYANGAIPGATRQ